ncbi:CYTH and CHAD domain-containing protein [Blastococcus mobilis]|uniref:Inorganic triphosphatase YgiF, contains CYTH and CHAD domains n=1 Tax=Blastococcus mobilis TaxID=1938746 RepID=A0A238XTX8_9ACTN|nr:CYTH and CHAD domain-containing protein [Blastococcus mobilis]SNR61804.1 Inorganic triphosphatase YgiF, contains CYTH and CHAD domains [Blastococcus mobilis]
MTSGHLEIETKYDVGGDFELPALDGLDGVATVDPPVEHALEAVYHDAADLRLLRARVTLRRRTGGPDAGWHLKLPAGAARRELHAPLGRAVKKPPQALMAPVAGILRGAPTGPVATLRTRRVVTALRDDDGRLLAEVADDTVTATALAVEAGRPAEVHVWREVEVELGDGGPEDGAALATAVGERLVAAGARPSVSPSKVGRVLADRLNGDVAPPVKRKGGDTGPSAGEFVVAALREQLARLEAADVLLRTEQPDAVHQVRVAARRLRSTLAAFRAVLDKEATGSLREELAWLGAQLAEVRDDEVALAHLSELVAAEPEELVLGPVAARLQQSRLREEQAGLDRALQTVSEPRYLRLLDAVHDLVTAPPFTEQATGPVEPVLRDAVRRSVRRLRRHVRSARRAAEEDRPEALHAVRKAAKRVRYATEIATSDLDGAADVVDAAKQIQQVLGDVQDTVVTRELCRRFGVVAFAQGENAFTFGRLHALEQARAERAVREFWKLEPTVRRVLKRAARQRGS